jgi:hypothetical protein
VTQVTPRGLAVGCGYGLVVQGHEMFILDFFLAVFALAPFGFLVLFWKEFHEDRGVHPIYRNSTTEITIAKLPKNYPPKQK